MTGASRDDDDRIIIVYARHDDCDAAQRAVKGGVRVVLAACANRVGQTRIPHRGQGYPVAESCHPAPWGTAVTSQTASIARLVGPHRRDSCARTIDGRAGRA